jgi:exodeoxyribonuclease VII small subunit
MLYTRLHEIVAQLERGELSLDESLALYEQGVQLASACQRLLDQAEQRVQMLQNGTGSPGING